nr:GT-D fold domain-containing glycosyltransferase [Cohnella sp. WQ 127256]
MQSATGEVPKKSNDKGYLNGVYDGGDGIVDTILPELDILPDISVQQIILAGLEQMRPQMHKLLSATEISEQLIHAMNTRTPLSIVRLGDGELLTLAQEVVMNGDTLRKEGHFLDYAGVHLPDLFARDQLVQAIRKADIVGIPKLRLPNFQPLAFTTFRAHGIDFRQLRLTLSTINYAIYSEGLFRSILANRRVLLVGNSSPELAPVLSNSGIHVAGTVSPVNGIPDIQRVMGEISAHDFDIALVGAGVPAVIIVQRIASELGKVAIDFGHLADSFVNGEATLSG